MKFGHDIGHLTTISINQRNLIIDVGCDAYFKICDI